MSSQVQIWAVIIIYLVACIGGGLYLNKRKQMKSANDYFMNSNSMPPLAVALSIVGAVQSAVAFLGQPGACYSRGYGQMIAILLLGSSMGMIVANLLLAKPMHHMAAYKKYNSTLEMLCDIYQTKVISYIVVPSIAIGSFVYATVQWVAIGRLFSTIGLGLTYNVAVIIGAVAIASYVIFGGNSSNTTISIFQMFIAIFASVFIFFMAVNVSGGWTQMNIDLAAIDSSMVSLFQNIAPATFFSYIILYTYGLFAMPHVSYKYMQLKETKLIPVCLVIGAASYFVTSLNPIGAFAMRVKVETGQLGADVAASIANSADTTIPLFISNYASPIMTGLLVAACLACIMTTIASHVVLFSSAVANDMLGGWFKMDMSGMKGVKVARIVSALFMIVTVLLAFNPPSQMFTVVNVVNGLQCGVLAAPLLFGLRWRRATKQAAIVSMVYAFLINIVPWILGLTGIWTWPWNFQYGAFSLVTTIPLFIIVSLLTPKQEKPFMPPTLAELKAAKAAKASAR